MLTRIERFKMWAGFDSTYRRIGDITLRGPKRLLDKIDLIEMTDVPRRLDVGVLLIPENLPFEHDKPGDDAFMRVLHEALRRPIDPNGPNRSCIRP